MSRKPPRERPSAPATVAALVLALVSIWMLFPGSKAGSFLSRKSYDLLFLMRGALPRFNAGEPVSLVYLDTKTFSTLGRDPSSPLDRRVYASLVRRAKSSGASAVIFDVLFEHPSSDPVEDLEFASAIKDNGKVILGAEWHRSEHDTGDDPVLRQRSTALPTRQLLDAAAGYGFTFARIDPDLVVREYFPGFLDRGLPSLTYSCAKWLNLPVVNDLQKSESRRWVNYRGPALSLPNVSLVDALDAKAVPDAFFKGRVVFVGARATAGRFDERRDEWRSPYSGESGMPFMPSVEVHATQMANLLRGDWLTRPQQVVEVIAFGLIALSSTLLLFAFSPLASAAWFVVGEVGVAAASLWMFSRHQIWIPWLVIAVVQLPAAFASSVVARSAAWYRQRRLMQRRIRDQAALIDKAQDAILVSTLSGSVFLSNPRARLLYQFDEVDQADLSISQPWFSQDRVVFDDARKAVLVHGEWVGELTSALPDGRAAVVESRWTLIRNDAGNPVQILHINTDVTEKKRLQEQFLRVQRMETIGAVAGGMAHDLNNVFGPVLMGVQRLKKRAQGDESLQMFSYMEASLRRGADMVRQVLLFTRGKDSVREEVDVRGLLREIERLVQQSFPSRIKTSFMSPSDLWPVAGNATQLHQVLLNLCVNARDAMPEGGEINLAADNVELTAEAASGLPDAKAGKYVVMMVSDSGPGMTPEVRARLFEPFFSTKPSGAGTGLGLSTTAGIVRSHGGFISVTSELGEGSTFEIYIPALNPAPPPANEMEMERGRGELVLVVLPEEALRRLVADGLRDLGYRTKTAPSQIEALEVVRQAGSDLRVCIVDSMTALEGAEFASKALVVSPHLLIVECGAAGWDSGKPNVIALAKPFSLETLSKLIRQSLSPSV